VQQAKKRKVDASKMEKQPPAASAQIPPAVATPWVVRAFPPKKASTPRTRRSARLQGKPDEDGSNDDEESSPEPAIDDRIGVGRYGTEEYKIRNVRVGSHASCSFVKKGKTTSKKAKEAVEGLAKLVVDDFYIHSNRGLIIPSKAGFHYNG
jgi:hypothetical protein